MSEGAAAGGDYRVTDQVFGSRLDESGRKAVEGWTVSFMDGQTGVHGEVFVEERFYTPENVRKLILAKLPTIRTVHDLSG